MTNIKNEVVELISRLFSDKGFKTDIIEYIDLIDDAGMDSITFISIVVEIEAKFNIIVPDEMLIIDNFRNVDGIINLLEQERNTEEMENHDNGQA